MVGEQILKKEDGINYGPRTGLFHKNRGTLVLTKNDLYFRLQNDAEPLRVPLSRVLSVNTEKLDFGDRLFIVYKDGNGEHTATFARRDRRQAIFASASASHFASWEQMINNARFALPASESAADMEDLTEPAVTSASAPSPSPKLRLIALLLCFFLGVLGVHRFYVGKVGTGILMLLTLGGFGIWVLVDLIMIAAGVFKDKQERALIKWAN